MADYQEMHLSVVLKHYKRLEVQKAIVCASEDKEAVGSFGGKGYAKRPDIIQYPADVLELVKQGVTSFHVSEEIWSNPLQIKAGMTKRELDEIRKGWDLVIDIDCKFLEYSALAADLIIKFLRFQGIHCVSCKFSGNHGYHIGVPFEAFPEKVHDIPTRMWFPEGPRKIAEYMKYMIKDHLAAAMFQFEGSDINRLVKKSGKEFSELVVDGKFDPFSILELDTVLISSRHLFRMAYSLNEKSGLVSVPLDPSKILDFKKDDAKPENVVVNEFVFLNRHEAIPGEARKLLVESFDFVAEKETKKELAESRDEEFKKTKKQDYEELEEAVPEQFFPPCIQKMLLGMEDGKKRCLFILVNFLSTVGWSYEQIDERLAEWNEKNPEPLKEVYLKGQTRYHKQGKKKVLPPNCANKMYYVDLQFCKPDNFCSRIKNPANYAIIKAKSAQKYEKKKSMKNKGAKKQEMVSEKNNGSPS